MINARAHYEAIRVRGSSEDFLRVFKEEKIKKEHLKKRMEDYHKGHSEKAKKLKTQIEEVLGNENIFPKRGSPDYS